jgi:hypothetical protein
MDGAGMARAPWEAARLDGRIAADIGGLSGVPRAAPRAKTGLRPDAPVPAITLRYGNTKHVQQTPIQGIPIMPPLLQRPPLATFDPP